MKRIFLVVSLILLVLFTTGCKLVVGGDTTLARGQTYQGSVTVIGGNYIIEKGAIVDGSLYVVGGNVELNGEVTGDVNRRGGNVSLGPDAIIGGESSGIGVKYGEGPVDVLEIGPVFFICCCGLLFLLILIIVVLVIVIVRRKKSATKSSKDTEITSKSISQESQDQ